MDIESKVISSEEREAGGIENPRPNITMPSGTGTNPVKRLRIGGSRSRTGCNTCRIRRVKCDELRPGCMRCKKFGRECDGYETSKTSIPRKKSSSKPRSKALLPTSLVSIAPLCQKPRLLIFQDNLQAQYFRLFYEETSSTCSDSWKSPVWQETVVRACHDEPCILQCVVGIAALDKACRSKNLTSTSESAEFHHQYALQQYGKALKGLQEVSGKGSNSTRIVLIGSLLIYCFENFHGDARLALTHVQSALALMQNFLASNPRASTTNDSWSPAPALIEDDLVAMFTRLDILVMNWSEQSEPLGTLLRYVNTKIPPMPTAFANIFQASDRLDHILSRVFHWVAKGQEIMNGPKSIQDELYDENGILHSSPAVLDEIYAWQAAFEPILQFSRTPAGDHLLIQATLLRISSTLFTTSVRNRFWDRMKLELFDMFLPEYCEIVALCASIVGHPKFIRTFVFDGGLIPSLFVVITKCRDRILRLEAVRILKAAAPRREGVWDSVLIAKMGEELLRTEEETSLQSLKQWVNGHLQRLSANCDVIPENSSSPTTDMTKWGSRPYLLDWVERCLKILAIDDGGYKTKIPKVRSLPTR